MRFIIISITLLLSTLVSCSEDTPATSYGNITTEEAHEMIKQRGGSKDFVILDIRTPHEFNSGYIKGAINIDYYDTNFVESIKKLDPDKSYLIYCRSGNRSSSALKFFKQLRFKEVYNMRGGIIGWNKDKLPLEHID